jgi:hypothetical protein
MAYMPFKNGIFDLCYSVRAIKYTGDLSAMLREIKNVSKVSSSTIIFEDNNKLSFDYISYNVISLFRGILRLPTLPWKEGITKWTPFNIKGILKSTGYSRVSFEGIFCLPEEWGYFKKIEALYSKLIRLENYFPSSILFLAYFVVYCSNM